MAYSYVWPPGLPQAPQKGYSEEGGVLLLRTSMDAGPAKMRRIGKKPGMLNLTFIMTTTQVATLESFVENTIKGTARFGFTHPRTGVVIEARIVPQSEGVLYSIAYLAPEYYNVSVTFEVLP